MIHIRKAAPEDRLEDLLLKGVLTEGRHDLIMVLLEEDSVMGCCSMEIKEKTGIINSLFIKGYHRNQELADGLIRAVLYTAQKDGIQRAEVPSIRPTDGLFKKLGFKPDPEGRQVLQTDLEGVFGGCCSCGGDCGCNQNC